MTKQEIINLRWIELVGEENFPKLRLNDRGESDWRCRKLLPSSKWDLLSDRIGSYNTKFTSGKDLLFRPKTLKGIDTNNGWFNTDEVLPIEGGRYWCIVTETNDLGTSSFQWNCYYDDRDKQFRDNLQNMKVSHWRELVPNPLY